MSENYRISEIVEEMERKERELFFGDFTLVYQAGRIVAFRVASISKKADEETLRKQKEVSLGRVDR